MNPVALRFQDLKKKNQKALIPYIMGGDPDLATTQRLLEMLAENGADLIEVGVPFSDPLADGPVIQAAGVRALENGCTFQKLLQSLKPVLKKITIPVILMIYYNMIFQQGVEKFFDDIKEAGVAGLIIPDLPPDEADQLIGLGKKTGIGLNFLVAPTSNDLRIIKAAEASTGFVYAVSVKGVTGTRSQLPPELPDFIKKIKSLTVKPVAVGFGVSRPEQAKKIVELADGVIVGSAVIKTIIEDPTLVQTQRLITEIKAAIQ